MVLLVHGFPELWYSWRHQLSALADAGYHAVAVDQRGYGRSAKPPRIADYRITELVADLAGVVEALGESTATVVGHDWGAPVAWTAAWTKPETFTAVVGLGLPFGGRGLVCLPSSPFGERRPSAAEREVAGPGLVFYQEYFSEAPGAAEREFDRDVRGFLERLLYGGSALRAAPPRPPARPRRRTTRWSRCCAARRCACAEGTAGPTACRRPAPARWSRCAPARTWTTTSMRSNGLASPAG
jgi:pimeloyl-ACP methyl ester carboxylesterase